MCADLWLLSCSYGGAWRPALHRVLRSSACLQIVAAYERLARELGGSYGRLTLGVNTGDGGTGGYAAKNS